MSETSIQSDGVMPSLVGLSRKQIKELTEQRDDQLIKSLDVEKRAKALKKIESDLAENAKTRVTLRANLVAGRPALYADLKALMVDHDVPLSVLAKATGLTTVTLQGIKSDSAAKAKANKKRRPRKSARPHVAKSEVVEESHENSTDFETPSC